MSLKGKVVLITGASLGIGCATALKFANEGCKVALTYCRDEKTGKESLNTCSEVTDAALFHLDISDDKSIKKCVKDVVKKFKQIDILVNNAGMIVRKPFVEHSFEEIEQEIRVNLIGLMKMTHECLPFVKDTIINIASRAGLHGHGTLTGYSASKFGVRGFSQALAQEIKQKVIAINPATTATRMTNFRGVPPEVVADVIVNSAKGKYKVESGGDVNVWEVS